MCLRQYVLLLLLSLDCEVEELVARLKNPILWRRIKAHRLHWLYHVERKEEDRAIKRAYMRVLCGKRPVRCPKYRWKDMVVRYHGIKSQEVTQDKNTLMPNRAGGFASTLGR